MPKNKAYSKTVVDPLKSIADIKRMLHERGIYTVIHKEGYDPIARKYKTMLGFSLPEKIGDRVEDYRETPVGFVITLDHTPTEGKIYIQEVRSIYRVLLNHIKQIFVSIDYGLLDVKEAFMSNIMTRGPDGQLTTLYQSFLPNLNKAITDGSFNDVPLLPDLPAPIPKADEEAIYIQPVKITEVDDE